MRTRVLFAIAAALMAFACLQQGWGTTQFVLAMLALYFATALAWNFYVCCIRGVPSDATSDPCHAVQQSEIPGPVWDAIQRAQESFPDTGAIHLGYLRIPVGIMHHYSSAWWIDEGTTIIYASTHSFERRSGAHTPQDESVTCSSGTPTGDHHQTTNRKSIPSKNHEGHSVRSYPQWMPCASLLEVHRARLAPRAVILRRVPQDLDAIVELNNESLRRYAPAYLRGIRQSADGRTLMRPSLWARARIAKMPPISTIRRFQSRAIARRELRGLGLLHLWKKPA